MPGANPDASFVTADRQLLTELSTGVTEIRPGTTLRDRVAFARQVRSALTAGDIGLVVVWFAAPGYAPIAARLARRRGVPLLAVAGGTEVADCPELDFGDARHWWRRALVAGALNGAANVWAFSESARTEIGRVAAGAPVTVVPPLVDTAFFRPAVVARERLVVTACATISRVTARQKGLDRFVAVARQRPDLRFTILGRPRPGDAWVAAFVASAPSNVRFEGLVSRPVLRDWLARGQVYAQLSAHEGFGVAVAEAAAMGCVPVVTDLPALRATVGAIAEVVPIAASAVDVSAACDRALARTPLPDQWHTIDARFGPAVRRAAWTLELTQRGLLKEAP